MSHLPISVRALDDRTPANVERTVAAGVSRSGAVAVAAAADLLPSNTEHAGRDTCCCVGPVGMGADSHDAFSLPHADGDLAG